jgi:V8-like Glu-specific endopeptidase
MLSVSTLALVGATIAPAGAAGPPDRAAGPPDHAAVAAYWDAERVANATPRTLVLDPATGRRLAPVPGNGNGNGNGGGGGDGEVNCNKKSNRDLPECGGGGGGGDGGGGGGTGDLPATSTGSPWATSGYDTAGSDVRTVTGKVLFTLGSTDYVCSGSVVTDGDLGDGRALVLTAGHCVHQGDGFTWATNWTFLPDFDADLDGSVRTCDDSPYGCWVADALVTTDDWATVGLLDYDIGFGVVTTGGHAGQPLEDVLTAQDAAPTAIGFNRPRGEFVAAFGYPQASPYDGDDLIHCAGDAIPNHWFWPGVLLYSYHQGLACDMTGGSSGGPWYGDFSTATGTGVAMSVNSYKVQGDAYTIYGTYFGNTAAAAYQAAIGATSHTTVPRAANQP